MKEFPDRGAPSVVIVGGGFGGLYAARALAKTPVRVTIVDRRNHHLFQPLLYQVATAVLSPGDIAQPIRALLRNQKNAEVILAEALSVDVAGRRLVLADGELPYDHLILAPGSRHSYFGHTDWEQYAPGLKTVEDALAIRRRFLFAFEAAEREAALMRDRGEPVQGAVLHALMTFVIVGGGPTGVELAGAFSEIARHTLDRDFRAIDPSDARVILIEAGPRILASFPEELSISAASQLARLGVEVKTSSKLVEILPGRGVRLENGPGSTNPGQEWIATRTVLWAAGVAASPLARSLGVELDRAGRVAVAPDLSIPGHPEILVIGDLAAFVDQTGKPLPGVAPVAIQQGRHAARNIARSLQGQATLPFRYRNKGNLATIGRASGVADFGRIRLSGFVAWLTWVFVHIFFLIGFKNRLSVLFEWAWLWVTYKRGARLITNEAGSDPAPAEPGGAGASSSSGQ